MEAGAKHVLKSKCAKQGTFGTLLEVEMWKKVALWCYEDHLQANMLKTPDVLTTFGHSYNKHSYNYNSNC